MSDYTKQIEQEIEQEKKAISALYERIEKEGTKNIIEIYSLIASHQQSIEAKKQRLENIGYSYLSNPYPLPNNVKI